MSSRPASSRPQSVRVPSRALNYSRAQPEPNPNLRVVKSEIKPSGEAFHLIRPTADANTATSEQIISKLVNQYNYKTSDNAVHPKDMQTVHAAFPKVANTLFSSYEGSKIIADSQQDLIGDRYLAEQIRMINEENKKKSILDKWSHLLYEGEDEKTYVSQYQPAQLETRFLDPVRSQTFTLNSTQGNFNPNNY